MIGETGERKSAVATPDGKSRKKKYISRITFQPATLFAQCMRYLNLHIVCKNEHDKSAQSASIKKNHFFVTKVKLACKACFLAVGVQLHNFLYVQCQ